MTSPYISNVKLTPLPPPPLGELAEHTFRTCSFCVKEVESFSNTERISKRLCGHEDFYCTFCLRNNFHTRNSRHILLLSFRGIIGYYYYEYYLTQNRRMWLSEIDDYMRVHADTGLTNPVFSYDPTTLLWFVDFCKVGTSRKKIKVEEVLKTIVNILVTFNLPQQIPSLHTSRLFQKYKEAIMGFYSHRYRPEGRRMLIPTLVSCIDGDNRLSDVLEKARNFTMRDMYQK